MADHQLNNDRPALRRRDRWCRLGRLLGIGQAVVLASALATAPVGCSNSAPPTNPAATAARDFFTKSKLKPPVPPVPKEPPSPPAKQ